MSNKAINILGYTGIVTLSRYNGNKKVPIMQVHNNGGYYLFNFLADCLIGDFEVARLNIPTKLLLLKISEESGKEVITRESGFIYVTPKPEKVHNQNAGIVRFSFIIPRDYLENTSFNALGLYTESINETDFKSNYAALCKIDPFDTGTISPSSVLVVDWELNISNNEDKNTTEQFKE